MLLFFKIYSQTVGLCNTIVPFQQIRNIGEFIDQMSPNSIPKILGDLQDSAGWARGMNAIWFYYQNIKVSKSHKTLVLLPGISWELQDFRNFNFKTKLILNLGTFQMLSGTKCTSWHVMDTLHFTYPYGGPQYFHWWCCSGPPRGKVPEHFQGSLQLIYLAYRTISPLDELTKEKELLKSSVFLNLSHPL